MTISLPQPVRLSLPSSLSEYFQMAQDAFSSGVNTSRPMNSRSLKKFFKKSPLIPMGILAVFVFLVLTILFKAVNHSNSSTTSVLSSNNTEKAAVEKPKATQDINKTFTFSLKDETGKEVSKIKYVIQDAAIQDEIIVKGERARAVEGRTFLIINLKITNDFNKSVQINSRDYIRLIVNNSTERLAPDIHNDPVEVQAISTKYTRVGFPINDTDKNLTLQVGELVGPKEMIPLHLN